MKRKSIYKILWRVLLLCLAWRFTSVAGTGTAITAYIVFRAACFLLRVCLSVVYALAWLCFPVVAFLTDIITIKIGHHAVT